MSDPEFLNIHSQDKIVSAVAIALNEVVGYFRDVRTDMQRPSRAFRLEPRQGSDPWPPWRVEHGDVRGSGDSPEAACRDFDAKWYETQKA